MPASTSTNVKVFVEWDEAPVYAGEEVKCTITFTNVAPAEHERPRRPRSTTNGSRDAAERPSGSTRGKASKLQTRSGGSHVARPASSARGHHHSMSLSVPRAASMTQPDSGSMRPPPNHPGRKGHKHQRSVSIISLGGSEAGEGPTPSSGGPRTSHRPARNHARSASVQAIPKRSGTLNGGLISPMPGHRATIQASTAPYSPTSTRSPDTPVIRGPDVASWTRQTAGSMTAPSTPNLERIPGSPLKAQLRNFRFPSEGAITQRDGTLDPTARTIEDVQSFESTAQESLQRSAAPDDVPAMTAALSGSSINEVTPRSSGELFSLSNNSTETLVSDYRPRPQHRSRGGSSFIYPHSESGGSSHRGQPESLMMGYAQILGSFTLDGSLVNQAPFEEVKRKTVISGHGGGGVVGVGTKPNSGLFGALGWSQLGESLGGLLGTGELSTLKEMKGEANAKDIPLLRTPQSVLFVDLRLGPGESRSYRYRFTMPRGLPPSHRGRAIRISYQLVVGTQRAATSSQPQQARQVEIPFRVFGGVNDQGELLGHDLLSPRLILTDEARTAPADSNTDPTLEARGKATSPNPSEAGLRDLRSFIDSLLAQANGDNPAALLSPTHTPHGRSISILGAPSSVKEAIDLALLRGNVLPTSARRANRFDIARNGRRVAAVSLARSAYRLGETVTAAVDLSGTDVPCYAFRATLETAEAVDGSIALRSPASVDRVTRRIHATQTESTLFAQRVVCAFVIPLQATPTFITSGVSLDWTLRVEFVTSRLQIEEEPEDEEEPQSRDRGDALLEEVIRDDRGSIFAAVETLPCEKFDVTIPLRIYGPVSDEVGLETSGRDGWPV